MHSVNIQTLLCFIIAELQFGKMASSSDITKKRSCCTRNCSERVDLLKLRTKSHKDIVREYVCVYPCKTRKVQERIRPKNCYRKYFLPGLDGKKVKVCKKTFMKTVECSSHLIYESLKEVTKAITDKQDGVKHVTKPVHNRKKVKQLQEKAKLLLISRGLVIYLQWLKKLTMIEALVKPSLRQV